ncbi:MAG: SUMF1/EgtB/PvdO family nonheme iron enzyme [Burkholderiales bacterium]
MPDPAVPPAPAGPPRAARRSVDSPAVLEAGRDMLSLALIDSRNLTLHTLALVEQAQAAAPAPIQPSPDANPPFWIAGHTGWFGEFWIARNTRRALGSRCPSEPTRIASIEPEADHFWQPGQAPAAERWNWAMPDQQSTRAYLLETLETTLALLEKAPEDDDALYFFRAALAHEDATGERLVTACQTLGLALPLAAPLGLHLREPLVCPATRWRLGSERGGYVPEVEQWAHEVDVPEFEIDSQPVTWAQYIEFVDDGGYDREEMWSSAGWRWLARQAAEHGRRGPRHVQQIGAARFGGSGAVLQNWFGRGVRMAGNQQVMHLSWFEADAFARWAGRRLPSEVEWEVAAHVAARRGFKWGDVLEWTATTLRPWPEYRGGPLSAEVEPLFGKAKVLRGASFATRARAHFAKCRRYALPEQDEGFVGFRTCAI